MIDAAHLARKSFFAVGRTLNLRALAPRSFAGVGGILMLHRVSPNDPAALGIHSGLCVTPPFLDALFPALTGDGYDFVTMDDLPDRIANPTDRPFLAVTFDDGYMDNYAHGFAVLRRHKVPFTVYIAPGLVNGQTHLWWEIAEAAVAKLDSITMATRQGPLKIPAGSPSEKLSAFNRIQQHIMTELPEELVASFTRELARMAGIDPYAHNKSELMNWDQIRSSAADPLCTIGCHTQNHYHLARLGATALKREFSAAMAAIELETGLKPKHVAYPYGYKQAVGQRETDLAQQLGYATGVTTRHGMLFAEHQSSMTALPRISVNGKHQNVGDVKLMLSGITSFLEHRRTGPVTL